MAGVAHAAPGLLAAIHFQLKRALLHLLTSETESFVAIEAPWDVAVVTQSGKLLKAEEDKNSVAGVSQLGDRHEGLWKSLRNYTAAFVEGRLAGDGSVLTLCTNVEIRNCWAAEFIERAWDESDEWVKTRAAELLRLGVKPSKAIKPHVDYVSEHVSELESVLRCLEVIEGRAVTKDGATTKEIYRLLRAGDKEREHVLEGLMGWVGEFAASHIARGEPAIIPVAAFNTRYREELNRGRQSRLLRRLDRDFAEALTPERKKSHVGDVFQHQLKWVGLDRSPDIV
jgi:hypothetical protein